MAATSAGALIAGSNCSSPVHTEPDQHQLEQQKHKSHQLMPNCAPNQAYPTTAVHQSQEHTNLELKSSSSILQQHVRSATIQSQHWPSSLHRTEPHEPVRSPNAQTHETSLRPSLPEVLSHQPIPQSQRLQWHPTAQNVQQQTQSRFSYVPQRQQHVQQYRGATPIHIGNTKCFVSGAEDKPISTIEASSSAMAGATILPGTNAMETIRSSSKRNQAQVLLSMPQSQSRSASADAMHEKTPDGGPNVAPGWRRHILDNDIIYIR